jgi:Fe-S cluster biogenesis protein NfuA
MNTSTVEDLTQRVEASLDSIRPYLEADGGNVKITQITSDNVVKLEFVGACGTCPMSKAGVEEAIKKAVPEITRIEVINLHAN